MYEGQHRLKSLYDDVISTGDDLFYPWDPSTTTQENYMDHKVDYAEK